MAEDEEEMMKKIEARFKEMSRRIGEIRKAQDGLREVVEGSKKEDIPVLRERFDALKELKKEMENLPESHDEERGRRKRYEEEIAGERSEEMFEIMKKEPQFMQLMLAGLAQKFQDLVGPAFTAEVGENGRVTIPRVERDLNEIKKGDPVFVVVGKVERSGEKEAIERMKGYVDSADPEQAHSEADDILFDFLKSQGYEDLAEMFDQVPKWYA